MYYNGQFASDEVMKSYVNFICSSIEVNAGATVNKADGFPMKGCYVPVKLEIINKTSRTAEIKLTSLGHSKTITIFLSRHKSPSELLSIVQEKIDDTINVIIEENKLDKDKIWNDYHPLINLKMKNLKNI